MSLALVRQVKTNFLSFGKCQHKRDSNTLSTHCRAGVSTASPMTSGLKRHEKFVVVHCYGVHGQNFNHLVWAFTPHNFDENIILQHLSLRQYCELLASCSNSNKHTDNVPRRNTLELELPRVYTGRQRVPAGA